jgi:hypothetical protein
LKATTVNSSETTAWLQPRSQPVPCKVIVFSQFWMHLNLIAQELSHSAITFAMLRAGEVCKARPLIAQRVLCEAWRQRCSGGAFESPHPTRHVVAFA